jgi:hypothetical protein
MALLESGQFVWRSVMGSYKRVFDPLDLEIIDLIYEAALVQLTARARFVCKSVCKLLTASLST